jgi:DNA-binding CsgD family transcriptional regulator
VRMLCELYRLTPGETRLTEHLIDGFTLTEIAEIMNLKPSTVRVYLKQIFTKTGVKRQAMLIRLFLTSRMPFNFPEAYSIVSRPSRTSTTAPDRFSS